MLFIKLYKKLTIKYAWQLGIIPQMAPIDDASISRQSSESVYELDLD